MITATEVKPADDQRTAALVLSRRERELVTELTGIIEESERRGVFRRRKASIAALGDDVLTCEQGERERRLQHARDVFASQLVRFRRRRRAVQAMQVALPALVLALCVPPLVGWLG